MSSEVLPNTSVSQNLRTGFLKKTLKNQIFSQIFLDIAKNKRADSEPSKTILSFLSLLSIEIWSAEVEFCLNSNGFPNSKYIC